MFSSSILNCLPFCSQHLVEVLC